MTAKTNPFQKLAIAILWLFSASAFAQITVDTSLTTEQLVQDVLINGTCAETSNFISSTGTNFGEENGIASFDASGTDFPFTEGVVLTSGDVNEVPGPNTNTANSGGWPGDADLEAFTGATATNDASFIQFDFVPLTEQLSFDFIMASEEYNENFECTFSDAFAFILTDQTTGTSENLAVLPGTATPIEVTNIRPEVPGQCGAVNEQFFGQYNFLPFNDENTAPTNMNGQTVELTAMSNVIIGNTYTIKLVVADDADTAFNMSVFIEAGSFNIGSTDLGENLLIASGNAPCEGDTVTLDATDPDATSYTWFFNGIQIAGETGPTIDITEGGTYTVEVTLAGLDDCVISDEIIVEFVNGDAVALGDDIVACEGDTVTIDSGLPDDNATFVWLLDGLEITGETGPSLDVTAPGTYTIQATFNTSCTFPDDVLVTFNVTPTLDLGEDINSCLADPITLDGTPDNVDPAMATYQWFLDGAPIAGATAATLDAAFPGTYTVEVTLNSCVGTDDLIIVLANPDGTSCLMNDICMDAEPLACGDIVVGNTEGASTDGDPGTCGTTPGAGGVWFSFTGTGDLVELAMCNSTFDTKLQVFSGTCDALVCIDGNDDSCGLQSEVDFQSEVGVEYFFYVFGFGANQGDFELSVTCLDPPSPPLGCIDAMPFCSDDGLIFENTSDGSAAEPGIDYECLGSQPNPSWFFLEIEEAGDLELEIVQNTAFDADGNPTGNALDVDFIAWGPFTDPTDACADLNPTTSVDCSFSAAAIETFTIPNAQVGEIYIVLITNFNGGAGFISLGQTGGDGGTNCDIICDITIDLGGDQSFCDQESFEIVPTITGVDLTDATFLWNTGDTTQNLTVTETGTYTLEVSSPSCETTETASVFIELGVTPIVDLGEDLAVCDEASFEIVNTLTNVDAADATFLWNTGDTSQNLTVTVTGTYSVEVTVGDCTGSGSVFIQFGETPIFDLGPDFSSCIEDVIVLDASPSNIDPTLATYQWFQDGVALADVTSTLEIVDFGTYEVIVDFEGCTASDTITISTENLIVSLPEGFQTCPDETQTLVSTTEETGVSYQWFLNGDLISGATNATLEINIAPEALGEQIYEVEITRGVCTATAQIPITLYDVGNCTITQGISPDNLDGLNDSLDLTFLADRSGIENLQIFNRHGRLVFERQNYVNEWRGQTDISGDLLPTGTYFYVINLTSNDPEYGTEATGWIYLNRAE